MATLATVTARVASLLGADASLSTAEIESMAQTRYETLYESWLWSKRLRDFTISVVAQVESSSSNTVSVEADPSMVAQVAISAGTPFTSGMVGRQIQIGSEPMYFFVNSYLSTAQVGLGDGEGTAISWPRATETGASWRVFKTLYSLPATADTVLSLASGNTPLDEYDGGRDALDQADPYRLTTSSIPTHWLYAGVDSSGYRKIELWPVPTSACLLRGQFARQAPTLSSSSTVDLPVPLLVFGTAADCCNMLFAKTGDASWQALGLFYERKAGEIDKDFKPVDTERLSLPRSLGRASRTRFRGTDFEVSHDLEAMR